MTTNIKILVRSNSTVDNEYHCAMVESVPAGDVCVVYFGGNGTVDTLYPEKKFATQVANGDAKRIRNEIITPFFNDAMGIDIPVYAVAYDFDDYGGHWEIYHDIHSNALEINQKNMRYLFRKYLVSKISEKGTKIDVDTIGHRWPLYLKLLFKNPNDEFEFGRMMYDALLDLNYTDSEISRIENMIDERKQYIDDGHITDLFNRIIMPRLTLNGGRRSLNDALIEMRKITFVSHCYGAILVRKLQDEMRVQMPRLGYKPNEIKSILSQMLVIAHAPSGRLNKQTESFFSFASAFDEKTWVPNNEITSFITSHRNTDEKYMLQNGLKDMEHTWIPNSGSNMRAMFLPQNMGNIFIIPRGFDFDPSDTPDNINEGEHTNTHYTRQVGQNKYGWMLNSIEGNILINGIKNALAQADTFIPLPEVVEMMGRTGDTPEQRIKVRKIFEQMQKNGRDFLKNVFENAMAKLRNRRQPRKKQNISGNNQESRHAQ